MKSVEMGKGRIFVLSMETGETFKKEIESFCMDKGIRNAKVTVLGGIAAGSSFVSGPSLVDGKETAPISPIVVTTYTPGEFAGVGTVFPNESGHPVLHLHGFLGYDGHTMAGCFRESATVWLTFEAVIEELLGEGPVRKMDPELKVAPMVIE